MIRTALRVGIAIASIGILAPQGVVAQAVDHQHGDGPAAQDQAAHDHAGPVVPCTNLAAPPWTGLPEADRRRIATLQASLRDLATPDAALAAGFSPLAGDVPGMGVHYISDERTVNGVRADEPDHLLFSVIGGEERLVGAAYAFVDVVDAEPEIIFDSELAHWHDHPEIAPSGQTLHMLHVWFVPSSNGPFAGINFWLPFEARGITPPNPCWMTDPDFAETLRYVSFGLTPPGLEIERMISGRRSAAADEEPSADREEILEELDAAARADDLSAWMAAADRFMSDLSQAELRRTEMLLRVLTEAQMSSADRP